ncbi:hypothetical protein SARC_08192 [Sphaeroforma arctica JP610]|uniref:Uncharacterized protein n=1 Tax=Sphaeroforma arctica JP610 TaxID=667725 RepID=A0A0L0FRG4_9EUKA|nr:hypothetical protein SARC_08192 [Sphaeroforma arctica JP610]KNC79417.1 hypothetical protein SARC_08192 [Sphaeroforma arctica JP610]|eukprot:XP_014153319.1 hypothetical protein SARC_08192 [Sphaeroforma arctica JP610]
MAHHLSRLRDRQAEEGAASGTAGLFGMEMADAGGSDQELGARLGRMSTRWSNRGRSPHAGFFLGLVKVEPVNDKAVIPSLDTVHDSIDFFLERLFAKDERIGAHIRQSYRFAGLTQVLVFLKEECAHAGTQGVKTDPTPQEASHGDRYFVDRAMAALSDLCSQLKNQRKETQKDLCKLFDKNTKEPRYVLPVTCRRARSQASEDEN